MTTQKLFKRRVRARMAKTGESYTAARRHLVQTTAPRLPEADLAPARELASDERLVAATGRDWRAWIATLDAWGGRDHTHRETVAFLRGEHAVPDWWTQAVTNGYERATGIRAKHQQSDGFTVYGSKTVGVPVETLFAAFTEEPMRTRWLTHGSMSLRSAQPGKAARFDWADGATRILVTFEAKGSDKSAAHVSHERLPDAQAGERAKALWKDRLSTLKAVLEADR
jgi:hypothetical protein